MTSFADQRFLLGTIAEQASAAQIGAAQMGAIQAGSVPFLGLAAIHIYHTLRSTTYWYRRAEVWQLQNWKSLLAGIALERFFGDNKIKMAAAQAAEVALLAFNGVEAMIELKRECHLFTHLLFRKNFVPTPLKLTKGDFQGSFFSSCTFASLKETSQELRQSDETLSRHEQIAKRTGILSAILIPDKEVAEKLPPQLASVNTFRFLLREYCHAPLEMLPNHTFFWETPKANGTPMPGSRIVDVTNELSPSD